jgi:hypothetical protein
VDGCPFVEGHAFEVAFGAAVVGECPCDAAVFAVTHESLGFGAGGEGGGGVAGLPGKRIWVADADDVTLPAVGERAGLDAGH